MGRLSVRIAALSVLLAIAGCASTPETRSGGGDLIEMTRMAEQAYREGDYVRAADLYAGVVEAMPDQPEYWYRLGNTYARQGLNQEAALSYRQSLALDPANARGWHNLGMVQLKLANEAFGAGQVQGSTRTRAHEENKRLARATSDVLEAGRSSVPASGSGEASPAEAGVSVEAGGNL